MLLNEPLDTKVNGKKRFPIKMHPLQLMTWLIKCRANEAVNVKHFDEYEKLAKKIVETQITCPVNVVLDSHNVDKVSKLVCFFLTHRLVVSIGIAKPLVKRTLMLVLIMMRVLNNLVMK